MSYRNPLNKSPLCLAAIRVLLLILVVCGMPNSARGISGGQAVPVGQLEAVGTLPGCTATLIDNNLVLTAAHCVCHPDRNHCASRATFTLHDVFSVDNPNTPVDESKVRTNVSISGNVTVHPEYELRGWAREDYAVIRLDQPATSVAKVTPLTVEEPQNIPFLGDYLTLVGYGATGADCQGPLLGKMKLDVPITGIGWGGISFENDQLHACPGDSGGPALNGSGHVVGVASWVGAESHYRHTSYAYNWIFGISQPKWSSCSWVPIDQGGKNSHQPTQLCSSGGFLTALDLDGDWNISDKDSPVVGQALCCKVAGAETSQWDYSIWSGVEQAGLNSHSMSGTWCPSGYFVTGVDLDQVGNADAMDSPVIGQVQCSRLVGPGYDKWGSSYWMEVGAQKSHQAGSGWCLDGSYITQMDLDRAGGADPHDSPIIGQVKCSALRPVSISAPGYISNMLNRCIDVKGAPGIRSGDHLQLGDCETSGVGLGSSMTDQKWVVTKDGFIKNVLSGRCIDVNGAPGIRNGDRLQLGDCETSGLGPGNSQTDQKWIVTKDGFIKNVLSGRCVDVEGSPGTANGAYLQLWDCETSGLGPGNSPTDQKWIWLKAQ